MSWGDDVYSSPEKYGLEQVAQIDYSSGCYEFDYRVVWRHKETGMLYTAKDAGCSCPSPFESFNSLDDLERFSLDDLKAEVQKEISSGFYPGDDPAEFLDKIRKLAAGEL